MRQWLTLGVLVVMGVATSHCRSATADAMGSVQGWTVNRTADNSMITVDEICRGKKEAIKNSLVTHCGCGVREMDSQ